MAAAGTCTTPAGTTCITSLVFDRRSVRLHWRRYVLEWRMAAAGACTATAGATAADTASVAWIVFDVRSVRVARWRHLFEWRMAAARQFYAGATAVHAAASCRVCRVGSVHEYRRRCLCQRRLDSEILALRR
jgi:hypothetical protein